MSKFNTEKLREIAKELTENPIAAALIESAEYIETLEKKHEALKSAIADLAESYEVKTKAIKKRANNQIYDLKGDLPFWKIAREIGVSDKTLSTWLRTPLDGNKRNKIVSAIHKLQKNEVAKS